MSRMPAPLRRRPALPAANPARRWRAAQGLLALCLSALCLGAAAWSFSASAAPEQQASHRPLRGTYWQLTQLGPVSPPVQADEARPEPHLLFDTRERRVSGSGGCNRFGGSFTVAAERLSLGALAATEMACPQGKAQEAAFFQQLGRVARHRIDGERLTLQDAGGRTLAVFRAVDLR